MLKKGMIIQVNPLSKRMKDRVNSHGNKFKILKIEKAMIQGKEYDCLLESLNNTFNLGKHKVPWSGWVRFDDFETVGDEIETTSIF